MKIKIDKAVPIPVIGRCSELTSTLPMDDMEISDSFAVGFSEETAASVRSFVSRYGIKTGRVFTTKKIDSTLRVWRIA